MKPISPNHYLPTQMPYPACLFATTHPLRVNKQTNLRELFSQQRTTGEAVRVIKYQKSNLEVTP